MNNADFAKLMATAKSEKAAKKPVAASEPKKKKKRPRPEPKKQTEDDDSKIKYRDRTKERNQDANPDYEEVSKLASMDIEHSKYLGGDMKHTHLVKGLDFALLQKVKTEITSLKSDLKSQRASSRPKPQDKVVTAHKTLSTGAQKKVLSLPATDPVFRTRIGAAVFGVVCPDPAVVDRRQAAIAEKFSRGRTLIEFALEDPDDTEKKRGLLFESDIPTLTTRAKEDVPDYADSATAMIDNLDPDLLQRIQKIVDYTRSGSGKPRRKRERENSSAGAGAGADAGTGSGKPLAGSGKPDTSTADEEDDDIFGGIGKYEPPVPKKKKEDQ